MQHNDLLWRKECWHEAKTADLFNEATQTACKVKVSFRDTPYEPWVLAKWKSKVICQIEKQIKIAQSCKWNHCQ
jgi:hypothetical protein